MEFSDKTVIVTGGGTGIGRAVSTLAARKGARVAVIYSKSIREADETVDLIGEIGSEAVAIKTDVSDETQVKAMVGDVVNRFGSVDYLVNNAGATKQLPFAELDLIEDDTWDQLFAINVKSMFYCARAVAPIMKRKGGGAIVNVGSISGVCGLGSSLPYAVSKAAVHGLTKSLAHALVPEIRVNCVAPGAVDTRWWKGNEAKMKSLAGKLPLGTIASPEDIAEIVCMLLLSRSMTGQIVVADNGQTL